MNGHAEDTCKHISKALNVRQEVTVHMLVAIIPHSSEVSYANNEPESDSECDRGSEYDGDMAIDGVDGEMCDIGCIMYEDVRNHV